MSPRVSGLFPLERSDFPSWILFKISSAICSIHAWPRGNFSRKNAQGNFPRNVVDRDPHQMSVGLRARSRAKAETQPGGRVGKVATSRATPPAGLPTSGVWRGER